MKVIWKNKNIAWVPTSSGWSSPSEDMSMCTCELRLYVCINTIISQSSGAPQKAKNRILLFHAQGKRKRKRIEMWKLFTLDLNDILWLSKRGSRNSTDRTETTWHSGILSPFYPFKFNCIKSIAKSMKDIMIHNHKRKAASNFL